MALLAFGLLAGYPHPHSWHLCGHVFHPQVGLWRMLLLRCPLRLSPLLAIWKLSQRWWNPLPIELLLIKNRKALFYNQQKAMFSRRNISLKRHQLDQRWKIVFIVFLLLIIIFYIFLFVLYILYIVSEDNQYWINL